jgi:hypothetical protein
LFFADNALMSKEQISIRLDPVFLKKIDELAANEKRTRNNMLEVLIFEALESRLSDINDRLFEQIERLSNSPLDTLDQILNVPGKGKPPKPPNSH